MMTFARALYLSKRISKCYVPDLIIVTTNYDLIEESLYKQADLNF